MKTCPLDSIRCKRLWDAVQSYYYHWRRIHFNPSELVERNSGGGGGSSSGGSGGSRSSSSSSSSSSSRSGSSSSSSSSSTQIMMMIAIIASIIYTFISRWVCLTFFKPSILYAYSNMSWIFMNDLNWIYQVSLLLRLSRVPMSPIQSGRVGHQLAFDFGSCCHHTKMPGNAR